MKTSHKTIISLMIWLVLLVIHYIINKSVPDYLIFFPVFYHGIYYIVIAIEKGEIK